MIIDNRLKINNFNWHTWERSSGMKKFRSERVKSFNKNNFSSTSQKLWHKTCSRRYDEWFKGFMLVFFKVLTISSLITCQTSLLISRNKAPKSHLYQRIVAHIEGSKMVKYVRRLAFAKDVKQLLIMQMSQQVLQQQIVVINIPIQHARNSSYKHTCPFTSTFTS